MGAAAAVVPPGERAAALGGVAAVHQGVRLGGGAADGLRHAVGAAVRRAPHPHGGGKSQRIRLKYERNKSLKVSSNLK